MAKHLKTEEIVSALRQAKGFVSVAARNLGCTRKTIENRAKKNPKIAGELTEQREFALDVAESSLYRAVQKGEAWAVCFMLKTQGKNRGYSEKITLDTSDGKPLVNQVINQQININDPMRMAEMMGAWADAGLVPKELVCLLADHTNGALVNGTG